LETAKTTRRRFGQYSRALEQIRLCLEHPTVERAELQRMRAELRIPSDFDIAQISWRPDSHGLLKARAFAPSNLAYRTAKFLSDPIWWFYLLWVPSFLCNARSGVRIAESTIGHDLCHGRRWLYRRRMAFIPALETGVGANREENSHGNVRGGTGSRSSLLPTWRNSGRRCCRLA